MAKKKIIRKKAVKKIAKKAPAKKKSAVRKATKKVVKKISKKKVATLKKKSRAKKAIPVRKKSVAKKGLKKAAVQRSEASVSRDKKDASIVFSLDDVEALVANRKDDDKTTDTKNVKLRKTSVQTKKKSARNKKVKKRVLKAASLSDILGFNPSNKKKPESIEKKSIPRKWMKFYRLLINLRMHIQEELSLHTAETLKRTSTSDSDAHAASGRNSQSDNETDTFDREFALSLVSSEQDALNEINEAIHRMKEGTYGACEVTGKAISKERLEAVPFARYSVEGQKEYEKNKRRKMERTNSAGIFTDTYEVPKITLEETE